MRIRTFRWFFIGRLVFAFGSAMSPVAISFGVLEVTGSTAALSFVLTAHMIPMIGLLLLGGGVADRLPREVLLRLANLGAGLTQAALAICLLTGQPLVALIVV